jgi:hypothetical protein
MSVVLELRHSPEQKVTVWLMSAARQSGDHSDEDSLREHFHRKTSRSLEIERPGSMLP